MIWTGNLGLSGYGRIHIDGDLFMVHRLVKALHDKRPYRGLIVHHECHRRACINPDHLKILTAAEHSKLHGAERAAVTVCARGHSMGDAYVRKDTGHRQCRSCIRERGRKQLEKWRSHIWQPAPPRDCIVCGKTFYPVKRDARNCGQKCRMDAFLARRKATRLRAELAK